MVFGCRHRNIALTIPPEEPVEQGGVDGVGTAEIEVIAFLPFRRIHLVDETVVAIAIVSGERRLLTRSEEKRSHDRSA